MTIPGSDPGLGAGRAARAAGPRQRTTHDGPRAECTVTSLICFIPFQKHILMHLLSLDVSSLLKFESTGKFVQRVDKY